MLDSSARNLMNVAESERFRVGRVAARRLRDPELLEHANARMAPAPTPQTPRPGQGQQGCVLCGSTDHDYSDPRHGGTWGHVHKSTITKKCKRCQTPHARVGPLLTECDAAGVLAVAARRGGGGRGGAGRRGRG